MLRTQILKTFFNFYFIYVYECFACYFICTPNTCRGQKGKSDSLELEILMIESPREGAGNGTRVFCKSNKCS